MRVTLPPAIAIALLAACPAEEPWLLPLDAGDLTDAGVLDRDGARPSCDDGNPCSADWLDLASGQCQHVSRSGRCDDENRCTRQDRCVDGACVGDAVSCDDGIACTIDYCDPAAGCTAQPDATRCGGSGDPCLVATCDLRGGCGVATATDGTECGPRSCAELAICVAGQCRRGPAPDGLPCDDGDPCTTGDTCNGGRCVAVGVGRFGVSTPTEVDLGSDVSDHAMVEPPSAVGVLAVGATSAGGIDVVWAHHLMVMSDSSVVVLRTRIAPDLSVVFHQHLARTQQAWAAFAGDQLVLLTHSWGDCESLEGYPDPAPAWAGYNGCGFVLHQFAAENSYFGDGRRLPLNSAIGAIAGATVLGDGPALAVDALAAYVAIPKQQFDPAGWSLGVVRVDLLDHTTQASLIAMDDRAGPVPFRHLRLATAAGLAAVAFERAADDLALPAGCAELCTDTALDSEVCNESLYRPGLTLLRGGGEPTAVDIARPRVRAIALSPQLGGSGVLLHGYDPAQNGGPANGSGNLHTDPPAATCTLQDRLTAFTVGVDATTVALRDLFIDGPGTMRALTAASLFGAPAALWHRSDGWIAIAGQQGETPVSIAISHPQSALSHVDRRFSSWSWSPFAVAATAPLGQGFVAALVVEDNPDRYSGAAGAGDAGSAGRISEWTASGIALLTAGCGVAIPPLR